MIKKLLFTVLMLCFCAKNPLLAQTTQASIFGIVTDQENKTIPGAIVQLKNNSTGFTTKTANFLSGREMDKIKNDADYQSVMAKMNGLMAKGSGKVSKEELNEIRKLAQSAQDYEQAKYVIEAPTSLIGMIEMRMFEKA